MRTKRNYTGLLLIVAALTATPGTAETTKWVFNGGGGFTDPTGDAGSRLNMGWNLSAGGGYSLTPLIAIMGEFDYDRFAINDTTLQQLGQPAGTTSILAFTANPMIRLNPEGKVDVYAVGGAGVYRRTTTFTQPTTATVTLFDPFFGYYSEVVPVNTTLSSRSQTKFGFNIGGGFTWKLGGTGARVYGEVRYHRISSSGTPTTFVPVTFGLRWQ